MWESRERERKVERMKERVKATAREGGERRGCTFACRAAVWLRCTPTTCAFCSFVPQPAALGFSAESENGFLPLCLCLVVVVVPMTTRRISRPLLSPSPPPVGESAFAGVRLSCRLKFQPSCALFPLPLPGVLSQTLPADLEHDVVSACATPLSLLFIALFKLSLPKLSRYAVETFDRTYLS